MTLFFKDDWSYDIQVAKKRRNVGSKDIEKSVDKRKRIAECSKRVSIQPSRTRTEELERDGLGGGIRRKHFQCSMKASRRRGWRELMSMDGRRGLWMK